MLRISQLREGIFSCTIGEMKILGNSLLVWSSLLLIFVGLTNALYLATVTASGETPICSIGVLNGCGVVFTSSYSLFFGIPLSLWGVVYFGGMFALMLLYGVVRYVFLARLLFLGGLVGALFSLYFEALQIFVIHALCAYCLLSAVVTIITFGVIYAFQPPIQKSPY